MNRRVSFRPEAEAEALETRDWYEGRQPGLGTTFRAALDETVQRAIENPLLYRRVRGETRRAILTRFPYAVYFRLVGDDILVLAVHGRQHLTQESTEPSAAADVRISRSARFGHNQLPRDSDPAVLTSRGGPARNLAALFGVGGRLCEDKCADRFLPVSASRWPVRAASIASRLARPRQRTGALRPRAARHSRRLPFRLWHRISPNSAP